MLGNNLVLLDIFKKFIHFFCNQRHQSAPNSENVPAGISLASLDIWGTVTKLTLHVIIVSIFIRLLTCKLCKEYFNF